MFGLHLGRNNAYFSDACAIPASYQTSIRLTSYSPILGQYSPLLPANTSAPMEPCNP